MEANQINQHSELQGQPLYFLPFDVQLQNIFAVEITARRFPVDFSQTQLNPNAVITVAEINIDDQNLRAQVVLSVQIDFTNEPRPFEISFKLLGDFSYNAEYSNETLQIFLQNNSSSVMLPFARELLASLCLRLQVPPLLLPLIQLAPQPEVKAEETQ